MKLALEIANTEHLIIFQICVQETVIHLCFKCYAARWCDDLMVFFVSDGEGDIQPAFSFKIQDRSALIEMRSGAVGRFVLVDAVGLIVDFEFFQIWGARLVIVQQVDGIILALGESNQEIAC